MDVSPYYRVMCQKAVELQNIWRVQVGDYISTRSSYCEEGSCSESQMCLDCAKMANTFVISGKYDYSESIGGTHWFYGGHSSVLGLGNVINSTSCHVMTKDGFSGIYKHKHECGSTAEKVWLPRQDQYLDMFLIGLTYKSKIKAFIDYIETVAEYNLFTDSLEMVWLCFYMKEKHNKKWNRLSNIMHWEQIE
ncbi:hypothetical protein A616_16690 [Brevibacillus brevis X23]|nr:hypothetical protein A616_16690 [Brevibacillus brevis X23]